MQLLEQRKGDIMSTNNTKTNGGGLKSLYLKEDWWAVWIGLGIVVVALILWATGQSGILGALNVKFAGYSDFSGLLPCVTGIFPNATSFTSYWPSSSLSSWASWARTCPSSWAASRSST